MPIDPNPTKTQFEAEQEANRQRITPQSPEEQQREMGLDPGNRGGFIGAIGDAGKKVGEFLDDTFSQEQVNAPTVNRALAERQPDNAATTGYQQAGAAANQQGLAGYQRATTGADQQRTAGTQAAALGADIAAGQRQQGNQALSAQQGIASGLQAQGQGAQNRDIAQAARAREQQYNALGGIQNFHNQGPGPSAAQAQLQMGSDAAMGQALALARSGRNGSNPAAERQAMFQNAATMQNLSGQQAQLRANEEQAWRGQQLQAMGMEQQGLQNLGGQALQQQGLNDQTALGYQNAANQAAALGYNAAQGFGSLGNQTQGQGQQYDLGLQGAANQREGLGNQMYLGGAGLQQQANELTEKARAGDRQAQLDLEKLQAEMAIEASKANAANDQARDSGGLGGIIGAIGGLFGSDERNKTRIKELEGELSKTYAALGGPPATAGIRKGGDAAQGLADIPAYSYEYKNPNQPGAAPGRHTGPMAQDLERNPATAGAVYNTPQGKMVDPGRLTLTNTAAIGEQARRDQQLSAELDKLREQVTAMGGNPDNPYSFTSSEAAFPDDEEEPKKKKRGGLLSFLGG